MKNIGLTMRIDRTDHGETRHGIDTAWLPLLSGLGFAPILLPATEDGAEEVIDRHNLSAVILSGGNDVLESGKTFHAGRNRFESNLIAASVDRGLPVLGICRGLQMINLHFGGTIGHVDGHVARDHAVHWRGDDYTVNSYHNDGILRVAPGLIVEATAADGSVEALRHADHPVYGMMWHPERAIAEPDRHHRWMQSFLNGQGLK